MRILLHLVCWTVIVCSFVVFQMSNGFNVFLNNHIRIRRQSCPFAFSYFRCKSGECIDGNNECDGTADCEDGSDETEDCKNIQCLSLLFTCNYGACIKKELECNGHSDCRDGSDESSPKCTKTNKTVSSCKEGEFRCSSGHCIDKKFKCDGKADCVDHTDEIRATCFDVECPGYKYKCDYGACAVAGAKCNGVVDCFDGSDEYPEVCKHVSLPALPGRFGIDNDYTPSNLPEDRSSCIVPPQPHSGHRFSFPPGSVVKSETALRLECDENYILDGNNAIFCDGRKWSATIGKCLKKCPPRLSTPLLNVTCHYNNRKTQNCTEATDGTLAESKCAPYYEDFRLNNRAVHLCKNGSWDQDEPKCLPVCGQKSVKVTKLIVGGAPVKTGEYPWQVALYTVYNDELICSGSLLSQRVILTAAHCITDNDAKLLPKENYMVVVGNYYRKIQDEQESKAQSSKLHAMYIPREYQSYKQNYLADIAILVTVKMFDLSVSVQPVCFDSAQNFNVSTHDMGFVTGWGFTVEDSKPSDVLKELHVPIVDIEECRENLTDYDKYMTYDKICAGYFDKGESVCNGDSGGGLVFQHNYRYWITGIVSIAPRAPTGGCDSKKYGLYTNVSEHIQFILDKLHMYKI